MEDRAKDWWDAVEMRYSDGISWDQFSKSSLIDSFLRVIRIRRLRSFSY